MIVRGRVQGVGFRFFVRELAAAMGVRGWVRNRADGSVEIHAEGDRETLVQFIEKIEQGPRLGYIYELTCDWVEPKNTFASFDIAF